MISKFLTLSILGVLNIAAFAQTGSIKGIVVNSRTTEALPYATVFINYTTLWTTANENGEFLLDNIPLGQHELAATFVGHQSYLAMINLKDSVTKYITIKLNSNPLREVEVTAKRDKEWNRQYDRFKKLFLGNSVHASGCKILNPWVLEFKTDKDGFFTANSPDVLEIENHSLGYKLFYQLKNFSYGSVQFTISGNVRFEYIETLDSTVYQGWIKNREEVYAGSVRHLFSALIDSTLPDEGFELYKDDTGVGHIVRHANLEANVGKGISNYSSGDVLYNEISPNNFKVNLPSRLEVHYLNRLEYPKIYRNLNHPVSWLEVSGGYLFINREGIVLNPSKLVLSGRMSDARIAELLPYDFKRPKLQRLSQPRVEKSIKPINPLSYLVEKPYLHTDKSYYYPNEMVWFRGYINYAEPIFQDSLSKVLYVDLINRDKKILSRKILPIVDGAAVGSLMMPSTISRGDYILRAYTRWMLNFDESLVFSKPIKVLAHDEIGVAISDFVHYDSTNTLTIILDKDKFRPREQINIMLGVQDDMELFQPGNFSISVTDIRQVVPAENERVILTDFPIHDIPLPDSISSNGKYPVQRGIDLRGQLFTKRGKPMAGTLTIEQENSAGLLTITTEKDGKFSFSDLQLYDSAKLFVLAKTTKGLVGKLVMDSSYAMHLSHSVEPLKISVAKSDNLSRYNSWETFSGARLLKEIVIEDTRLEDQKTNHSISAADYIITGESLRAGLTNDIMMVLQSNVPGLRVIGGTIVLGSPGTFGNPEALVLIDGLVVNGTGNSGDDLMQESALDRISSLSPQEIEAIEVLKYSSGSAYGSRGANGVILITTRKPEAAHMSVAVKGKFQEVRIPGFSSTDKFSAPDYSKSIESNSRPDYRSTIYWNPYVVTDQNNVAEVAFYAGDLPTQYRIVVEGIMRDGRVVHGEKLITIISDP